MKLSQELKARGFINQFSGDSLENILDGDRRTFYLGADPTATSLTIGNLAVYMLVRHLADAGHTPILLIGGGTGMIGDPGGKDSERTLLDDETLQNNIACIRKQVENILNIKEVTIVNNADWLNKLSLIDFLRDVGKHFTVNSMIKKDIVKSRLDVESPISYTEFSYSLLQGYDFRYLFDKYNCTLQVSGADQWTNILSGIEYIRKTRNGAETFAITIPMIVNPATGKKFGKSEGGALWLDREKTSPYKLYQYFLNVDDVATDTLLKIYTLLSLEEIEELSNKMQDAPQERAAQKALAYEVTNFVHGEEAANGAQAVSEVLFGGKDIGDLSDADVDTLKTEAPVHKINKGDGIVNILVDSKLVSSKTEARAMIEQGAVSINGIKITDTEFDLDEQDFDHGIVILRKGKKQLKVLTL
jgi:tyrosyl-tRNA synthetase